MSAPATVEQRAAPALPVLTPMRLIWIAALAVAAVLAHAGVFLELEGIGLWPAAGAHGVLSVWCIASLRQV